MNYQSTIKQKYGSIKNFRKSLKRKALKNKILNLFWNDYSKAFYVAIIVFPFLYVFLVSLFVVADELETLTMGLW